ncbi:DNA-binding protein HU-alpha [Shimia gijangensis]|uniref:DNA-binding protein HU-alpha n=1 Tax=Shimia gijangensis TaxID=1470563 RepID=A0A1M6N908_9RHOB|nr:HU family DNA-binding protein [Shimia gijangensis]SHJ92245.1 DNA-binding protein HU-alpha [Shimia gijangensis]
MAKPTTGTQSVSTASAKATKSVPKVKSSTSSTAKTTPRKAPPKPASQANPVVVTASEPVVSAPELKKKDLIDAVVEQSGIKKKFAKPVIEATLAVLGETLADGRGLNLRPFGKMKIQRSKDVSNGKVMTVRVRQPLERTVSIEGLADSDEQS